MCRLFGLHAGRADVPATFWLLDAPDSLSAQSHRNPDGAGIGVFGPDGTWLIEGHGVDPDVTVDNLPHATFLGSDAQLDAAIAYLQREIKEHPVPPVKAPQYPNKALREPARHP